MVDRRLTDGKRIAQLLASELSGRGGDLEAVAVTDADQDAEPTDQGTFAYAVVCDEELLAEAYIHPERARLEVLDRQARAAAAAKEEGLRVRPKATQPPRTLVFVEDGAEVKRAAAVVAAVARAD